MCCSSRNRRIESSSKISDGFLAYDQCIVLKALAVKGNTLHFVIVPQFVFPVVENSI
jgi:hypothetical protein